MFMLSGVLYGFRSGFFINWIIFPSWCLRLKKMGQGFGIDRDTKFKESILRKPSVGQATHSLLLKI
jgi:hypothetical protein